MVGTLHFDLRDAPPEFWDGYKWNVLTQLILHANIRNRCWPTVDYLSAKMGKSTTTAVGALRWLRQHGAFTLVAAKERVGVEKKLPNRQHVYQLTGELVFEGVTVPYLYIGREHGQVKVLESNTSDSKSFSSENQTDPNTDSTDQNLESTSAAHAAGPQPGQDKPASKPVQPHIALIDAYHNALPDDVRPPDPNYSRNAPAARKLRDAPVTPDQVAAFVSESYPTYRKWSRKHGAPELMSLDHVVTYIKSFLARKEQNAANQSDNRQTPESIAERQRQLAERFDLHD